MPVISINDAVAPTQAEKRRSIAFLNLAHAIDHFVLLIFPSVVIGLEAVFGRPYEEMIALSTAGFVAFGVFALPAFEPTTMRRSPSSR